ncbi:MAG TPA: Zn-ribbon domain-containing OB-fold protein [Acidimicrobiales bacterium]|nr:Zn-ribbon domain-containing OB-fold protein [Acidimicrobiales bacterium]
MGESVAVVYCVDADGAFSAPFVVSYPYSRTVGPHIGRFLTGLRNGRIEGVRASDGRVLVPPAEFDPVTGAPLDEWVAVADEGTVVSWAWVPEPLESQPFDRPFAYALIRLDGADTGFLHAVDVAVPAGLRTGTRVRARWATEREGVVTDIACFEVVA